MVKLGIYLAVGLVSTHHLVPPTPGPLGTAGIFGADMGKMILWGTLFAIPVLIVGIAYATWLGRRIYQVPAAEGDGWERKEWKAEYEQAVEVAERADLPGTALSFAPIVVPIILILLNTTLSAVGASGAGDYLAQTLADTALPAILLPFIIATALRLIQGSGTVAMLTAASITAPILGPLGVNPVFAAQAAAMGAFVFSYFNDSFYWVVNRFIGIEECASRSGSGRCPPPWPGPLRASSSSSSTRSSDSLKAELPVALRRGQARQGPGAGFPCLPGLHRGMYFAGRASWHAAGLTARGVPGRARACLTAPLQGSRAPRSRQARPSRSPSSG